MTLIISMIWIDALEVLYLIKGCEILQFSLVTFVISIKGRTVANL